MLKVLNTKDQQIAEAKAFAAKAKHLAESKDAQVKTLVESRERTKIMNELVGPLSKDQRGIMTDLL